MSSIYNINNIIMVNLYNDFILLSTTESKDNIYLGSIIFGVGDSHTSFIWNKK